MKYPLGAREDKKDKRDFRYHQRRAAAQVVKGKRKLPLKIDRRDECTPVRGQKHSDCVGFAVAVGIAEFEYWKVLEYPPVLSPWGLFKLAGGNENGVSSREVLKAWKEHGMFTEAGWPYEADRPLEGAEEEAKQFSLAQYERIMPSEIEHAVHAVGVVLVTVDVHEGWDRPVNGVIQPSRKFRGLHGVTIAGYTPEYYVIKNSWKPWRGSLKGFGLLPKSDLHRNVCDVWIAMIHNGGWLRRTILDLRTRLGI